MANYNQKEKDEKLRKIYEQGERELVEATVNMQRTKDLTSDSTLYQEVDFSSETGYFVNLSDLHIPEGDMYMLIDILKNLARIPGMKFGFGGDQINNSTKNSVGDTHGEVINPQNQVKLLARIIKDVDKDYDVIDKIAFIQAGNHENRSEKDVSLNPAYLLASELGIQHRYVKNIARVDFSLKHDTKPDEKVIVAGLMTHGEQNPTKPGAQAENALASRLEQGIDFVVNCHNHKSMAASTKKQINSHSRVNPDYMEVSFYNFGAILSGSEYADRAGYPFPRSADLEVLRITNIEGEKKLDFINFRSLVDSTAQELLGQVDKTMRHLEKNAYNTTREITKKYIVSTKALAKTLPRRYKEEMAKFDPLKNGSKVSNKIFFAPLSGFMIGNEDSKGNEKEIAEKVEILSKLNGSCKVVLNGDMVFYKKAFTLTNKNGNLLGEKFPEESFSYILNLAKLLEPIKDKIIAYNSGMQEDKIMKYHSEALAKMAMNRLQMDEKLCFMPYNKLKLESEQLKIQGKQVEGYNKQVLERAVEKAYKNLEKAVEEALPFTVEGYGLLEETEKQKILDDTLEHYDSLNDGWRVNKRNKREYDAKEDEQKDFLKDLLAKKLRAEKALLSLSEDRTLINFKFPLEEIELRTPHENLVQHILCQMLEIDPKNITINSNPNTTSFTTTKVKDDKNKTRNIGFIGGASKSLAKRATVESHLRGEKDVAPGANVYYTNTRRGSEFMLMDNSVVRLPETNKRTILDTFYIAGGRFDGMGDKDFATNKIYKFFSSANQRENEKPESRGIYETATKDFNLYCETLNYETALLEPDVLSDIIASEAARSYEKSLSTFEYKKVREKIKNLVNRFEEKVSPTKKAKKIVQVKEAEGENNI
jgi:hypothetical protein